MNIVTSLPWPCYRNKNDQHLILFFYLLITNAIQVHRKLKSTEKQKIKTTYIISEPAKITVSIFVYILPTSFFRLFYDCTFVCFFVLFWLLIKVKYIESNRFYSTCYKIQKSSFPHAHFPHSKWNYFFSVVSFYFYLSKQRFYVMLFLGFRHY